MVFELELVDEAKAEYHEIIDWYERQQKGVGNRFYSVMNELFQKPELHLLNYSYYLKPYRHTILKGFPYRIVLKLKKTKSVFLPFFI